MSKTTRFLSSIIAAGGIAVFAAQASYADHARAKCLRHIHYSNLLSHLKERVDKGETVTYAMDVKESDYSMAFVFKIIDLDPELVTAVFTSYAEHKGRFPSLSRANVEETNGSCAYVRYTLDLQWPIPNSDYTVKDCVSKYNLRLGSGYIVNWDLVWSGGGTTDPDYVDGYMRAEAVGARTFIAYCNYVVPGSGLMPGKVNSDGLKNMKKTVESLGRWATEISGDQAKANRYLERFRDQAWATKPLEKSQVK